MEQKQKFTKQKFIDVKGAQVMDLTPDHERQLALVDLKVLNRLTEHLPTSDHFTMKRNLRNRIMDTENLEALVRECEEFVAFHKTVNLIQDVTKEINEALGIKEKKITKVNLDEC